MLPAFNLRLTPRHTLTTVLGLRAVAIVSQLAVLALAVRVLHLNLPLGALLGGIAFLSLAECATLWRLRRGWPVTELEIALQLLVDVAVLSWLLYFAGGSSNPFAPAYLVPVALAAIALRPALSIVIVGASIAAYTLLFRFHVPLPSSHHEGFALHVFGMWVNFVLSALLIAGILWLLAENLRRRDRLIAEAREKALRNEHVVALGALAASAAHELSTPLSTAALLADEIAMELDDTARVRSDLALLKEQIRQCKASLSTLLAGAGRARMESSARVAVDAFLADTSERWRLLRPDVTLATEFVVNDLQLLPEQGLSQALINLLNNAADASAAAGKPRIALHARIESEHLIIEILDEGRGIDAAARELAGRAVMNSTSGGAGLGLLLSNATLARWDGELALHPRAEGGTLTRIRLPLARLGAHR